jgi:hypothetical protein
MVAKPHTLDARAVQKRRCGKRRTFFRSFRPPPNPLPALDGDRTSSLIWPESRAAHIPRERPIWEFKGSTICCYECVKKLVTERKQSGAALPTALLPFGGGILTVTGITVSGSFAETNTCGATVKAGANCTISVTFKPNGKKGTLTGSIAATDNATGSPQSLPLTGMGTYMQFSPTSVSFGSQPVGTQSLPEHR